jgi:hypothetical protein
MALPSQRKRTSQPQRGAAWTSAILWIDRACHTGAMARFHKLRRHGAPIDDLYDYASVPARRRPGRHTKADRGEWIVTDDWPEDVPVTDAEVDVFEAWFGELLDELFSPRH